MSSSLLIGDQRLGDRRAGVKTRHRDAIVGAAAALMGEREGTDFTVDELAQRADVSRRTIFNHFASLDDIVAEVCSDVIGSVLEKLAAAGPAVGAGTPSVIEELTEAFRAADLVGPMAFLTRVLGAPGPRSASRESVLTLRAFTELSEQLVDAVLHRRPTADRLTLELLVGALTSGLVVLHRHWAAATGAVDTPESRRVWAELLERLFETVRAGHDTASVPCSTPQTNRSNRSSVEDTHG